MSAALLAGFPALAQSTPQASPPAPSDDDVGQTAGAVDEWTGVFRVTFEHSGSNPDDRDSTRNIRGIVRVQATGIFRIRSAGESEWNGKVITTMETNGESSQEAWHPVSPDTGGGFFNLDPDPGSDERPWRKFGIDRESQSGSSVGEGFLTLEIKDGAWRMRSGAKCKTRHFRNDHYEGYGAYIPNGEFARRQHPQMSDVDFSVIGSLPANGALREGLSGSVTCPVLVKSGEETDLDPWRDSWVSVYRWQETWLYQNTPEAPKATVEWNLKPARAIQVEFRTGGGASGNAGVWKPAEQFVDFLVGKRQPPIEVRIITNPEDAEITWKLEPLGQHSGTLTPDNGTEKEFAFSPIMPKTPPRTPSSQGSKAPNDKVGYRLTVWDADHFGRGHPETIEQDIASVLRQEYVDYGLQPPDRALVGEVPTVPSWLQIPDRTAMFGNYSVQENRTLNGGWFELVRNTHSHLGATIEINSAYRNPQRNRSVGGAAMSIHQMAGAVDMDPVPDTPEGLVQLYRSALAGSNAANIFLEKQVAGIKAGVILLPKNWKPPPANHTFTAGDATVTVEDSNQDDLPDRVVSAQFTETRLNIYTQLPYPEGGGQSQPSFVVIDYNNSKRIDAGDGLELVYLAHPSGRPGQEWIPPEELQAPPGPPVPEDIEGIARTRWRCRPLRWYFEQASHVHCDNGKKPVPLQSP